MFENKYCTITNNGNGYTIHSKRNMYPDKHVETLKAASLATQIPIKQLEKSLSEQTPPLLTNAFPETNNKLYIKVHNFFIPEIHEKSGGCAWYTDDPEMPYKWQVCFPSYYKACEWAKAQDYKVIIFDNGNMVTR